MIVGIVKVGPGAVPLEEFREAASTAAAVSAFCAEHSPPLTESDYLGVDGSAVSLQKAWAWDFGASALIEIEEWRQDIIEDIREHQAQRLAEVIRAEHPAASGNMFSCSIASQDNWSKLSTLDTRGLVVYPFTVYTAAHVAYSLTAAADLPAAVAALASAVLPERASAESYIQAVLVAADETAAIIAAAPYMAS